MRALGVGETLLRARGAGVPTNLRALSMWAPRFTFANARATNFSTHFFAHVSTEKCATANFATQMRRVISFATWTGTLVLASAKWPVALGGAGWKGASPTRRDYTVGTLGVLADNVRFAMGSVGFHVT